MIKSLENTVIIASWNVDVLVAIWWILAFIILYRVAVFVHLLNFIVKVVVYIISLWFYLEIKDFKVVSLSFRSISFASLHLVQCLSINLGYGKIETLGFFEIWSAGSHWCLIWWWVNAEFLNRRNCIFSIQIQFILWVLLTWRYVNLSIKNWAPLRKVMLNFFESIPVI